MPKAHVTRENKVLKDCWVDCRQLDQFEHMNWAVVKKDLSNRYTPGPWFIHRLVHCGLHNVVRIRSAAGASGE